MQAKNEKTLSSSAKLPDYFGPVSAAIVKHEKFREFHDKARELAMELGAHRKTPEQLLEAVEAHRQRMLLESVNMLKETGFEAAHAGAQGYEEIMEKIEAVDNERFMVISACWALEHGLQKAANGRASLLGNSFGKAKAEKSGKALSL